MNGTVDLIRAAEALLRAEDAVRDAINGLGHPGTLHDDALWMGPTISGVSIRDAVADCAACGGAQYGADEERNIALGNLRVALGRKPLPWEYIG